MKQRRRGGQGGGADVASSLCPPYLPLPASPTLVVPSPTSCPLPSCPFVVVESLAVCYSRWMSMRRGLVVMALSVWLTLLLPFQRSRSFVMGGKVWFDLSVGRFDCLTALTPWSPPFLSPTLVFVAFSLSTPIFPCPIHLTVITTFHSLTPMQTYRESGTTATHPKVDFISHPLPMLSHTDLHEIIIT
jgi:hypothetical protein